MALLKIKHNWASSYKVTFSFKTGIDISNAGYEQRLAYRVKPRKTFEYEVLHQNDQMTTFMSVLRNKQNIMHTAPDLARMYRTTVAVAAGASTLVFTAIPKWLTNGRTVVFGYDPGTREILTVAGIVGTTVTFSTPFVYAHPSGSRLYAGVLGRLSPSLGSKFVTDRVQSLALTLEQDPGSEFDPAPAAATTFFNNREVLTRKPNWAGALDVGNDHPIEVIDYDSGVISAYSPILFGTETMKFSFNNRTPEDAVKIEDMFYRMYGRQREFYAPTWRKDMSLNSDIPAGDTFFYTSGSIRENYADSQVYKAVCFVMTDGTLLLRQVSNIIAAGSESAVLLTEAFPQAIPMASVDRICWLLVCRFATDSLTTEWITDRVSRHSLSIQSLPALTPEIY